MWSIFNEPQGSDPVLTGELTSSVKTCKETIEYLTRHSFTIEVPADDQGNLLIGRRIIDKHIRREFDKHMLSMNILSFSTPDINVIGLYTIYAYVPREPRIRTKLWVVPLP